MKIISSHYVGILNFSTFTLTYEGTVKLTGCASVAQDAEESRWVEVNSQWKDGYWCREMDEQVQVSGGREEGR